MPYPFILPTTSSFSFSSSFTSDSHPSLPLNASTYRGVVRDTLKKHKRLPPGAQAPNLSLVISNITAYIPYALALEAGLRGRPVAGTNETVAVTQTAAPKIEWRPTLADGAVPGREPPRVRVADLAHDVHFALAALANAHTLQARAALQPLYAVSVAPPGGQARQAAVAAATRSLLDAAAIYTYLDGRPQPAALPSGARADIGPPALRAQAALALAEATLLAVLKDDPYPSVVAADRNAQDREWMYKAPDIPKVRAHLFARLCLAAAEHAGRAAALGQGGKASEGFARYISDLRGVARAKACRFFGIDAELGGETGAAIGWLHAGLAELGVERKKAENSKTGGLGRLKKEWTERREDRKVEKGSSWGADAGKLEETRVLEMLETKWTKQNDTMNTQLIPAPGTLLAQMPSGRDIHTVKPWEPPTLDSNILEAMRAPPDRLDDFGDELSSDDEVRGVPNAPAGAFPGTADEYTGRSSYY